MNNKAFTSRSFSRIGSSPRPGILNSVARSVIVAAVATAHHGASSNQRPNVVAIPRTANLVAQRLSLRHSSKGLWPVCSSAELECGHIVNLGVGSSYRPKRMACSECGHPDAPTATCCKCGKFGRQSEFLVTWDGTFCNLCFARRRPVEGQT